MEKKVAVMGYGSIGKEIIASAKRQEIPNAKIVAVFDEQSQVVNSVDNEKSDVHLFSDFDDALQKMPLKNTVKK